MKTQSNLELTFLNLWLAMKGPPPVCEHEFQPSRKWRFDFAWPEQKLAVEIDGGLHKSGRHNRPAGYKADADKLNAAVELGWRVLRFTADHLTKEPVQVVEQVKRVLASKPAP